MINVLSVVSTCAALRNTMRCVASEDTQDSPTFATQRIAQRSGRGNNALGLGFMVSFRIKVALGASLLANDLTWARVEC